MPHYILDARTATPHFPGIGRYVTNLARAMTPLLGADERLTIIYDPAHHITVPPSDAVQMIPLAVSPFALRQQWIVPRLLRSLQRSNPTSNRQSPTSTLYHSPYIAMPYRPGLPTVLTVYDLIPLRYPEHSTARARLLIRWMTRLALRAARHVIAISEFTRQDFVAEFGLPPDRITAIPLAADPIFVPQPPGAIAAIRRKYDLPERFALYLGSNKPHKNLVRLVEAWRDCGLRTADCGLVIAGAWDERYPEARQLAESLRNVHWPGPLPEADLPALYAAAEVFVFPSLYEGFGLPVLEAMACGAPVICSNTSSLPEITSPPGPLSSQERGDDSPLPSQGGGAGGVGGPAQVTSPPGPLSSQERGDDSPLPSQGGGAGGVGGPAQVTSPPGPLSSQERGGAAALLIDPTDTAALADALCRTLSDDQLRGDLRRRGLAQAARFTWAQTAAATLALYRNVGP